MRWETRKSSISTSLGFKKAFIEDDTPEQRPRECYDLPGRPILVIFGQVLCHRG